LGFIQFYFRTMARDNSRNLLMKDWGGPFESCYPTSNVAADENDVDLQPKEIGSPILQQHPT